MSRYVSVVSIPLFRSIDLLSICLLHLSSSGFLFLASIFFLPYIEPHFSVVAGYYPNFLSPPLLPLTVLLTLF